MRKATLMILTAAMMLGMTACGGTKTENTETTAPATEAVTEAPTEAETTAEEETEAEEEETEAEPEESVAENGEAADGTLGQILRTDFMARAADETVTVQAHADALMQNPAILFGPMVMAVEPGLLTGFDNAEITGFKEAVVFSPMIGSIPFVGYIFELEEGADGETFRQMLADNANPRWNVCTEAEETVIEQVGNKVFFLMCPKTIEE